MWIQKNVLALCIAVFVFIMAFSVSASADSANKNDKYLIGKSDVLEINVWKEKDLTRTIRVRKDGKISLPLIDDVQAAGRTPEELKEIVQHRLGDYIENPTVTVIVQAQESRNYYIIGEVAKTGEYPLKKDLTVLQAIALAGGFTEWADKDDILLLRRHSGGEQRINVDYNAIVSGESPERNKLLQAGDTIIVQ